MIVAFLLGAICGASIAVGCFALRRRRIQAARGPAAGELTAAEVASLVSGLAHEIRNPLSTLKVNLELLAEDWRDAQQRPDPDLPRRSLLRLQTLRSEASRLNHTLEAVMRLVAQRELDRAPRDLNQVVQHLVEFFTPQARAGNVRLRVSLAPEPLPCLIDADLIQQALMNVILNAQQAMPDGGELIVRTARDADGTARVDIADTGCGIPPEMIDKIWQPYYSTKKGGSGLGLPTTRRIVREHNGSISVTSDPRRGTNFTIRLPSGA